MKDKPPLVNAKSHELHLRRQRGFHTAQVTVQLVALNGRIEHGHWWIEAGLWYQISQLEVDPLRLLRLK
jgi:hypothetical protein